MKRMRKQNYIHIGEKSCGYPKNLSTLGKNLDKSKNEKMNQQNCFHRDRLRNNW